MGLLTQILAAILHVPGHAAPSGYEYVSPRPDARFVSPWTHIAIRRGDPIDPSSVRMGVPVVVGSSSGTHDGEWILSDDAKTMVYKPYRPFALGETVSVSLGPGLRTLAGERLPGFAYPFHVSTLDPALQAPRGVEELAALRALADPERDERPARRVAASCDTLPTGYPDISLITSNDPAPGHVFLSPFNSGGSGHLAILDDFGQPIFYRGEDAFAIDFKRQPNGLLTYMPVFQSFDDSWFALDSSYAVVDSFRMVGYVTDLHDIQLLPNGHALLMAYDPQPVRMDTVVEGGHPNAKVWGLILQELDVDKNVVFEWRSWDHFEITDVASPLVSLTDSVIDYVHANAVELDFDGNLLLSSRHMNEITKIDRSTGDVIWRFGPNAVNNDFTMGNDPRGFSHQHDIRRLPNGNISLFNNGNFLNPQFSEALEYDLDEQSMTATLVWSYSSPDSTYGPFMGNAQRLPEGGTMIGWGGTSQDAKITEIHADGSKAYELRFGGVSVWTYRAYRFPWTTNRFSIRERTLDFGSLEVDETATLPLTIDNPAGADSLTITCFFVTGVLGGHPMFSVDLPVPHTLGPGDSVTVDVLFDRKYPWEIDERLYVRSVNGSELIAQDVALHANAVTEVSVAEPPLRFRLLPIAPNPFASATRIRFDLPRQTAVEVDVFDVRGRRVETLAKGVHEAGRHEVTWAARGHSPGLYFLRFRAGEFISTQRVALIR